VKPTATLVAWLWRQSTTYMKRWARLSVCLSVWLVHSLKRQPSRSSIHVHSFGGSRFNSRDRQPKVRLTSFRGRYMISNCYKQCVTAVWKITDLRHRAIKNGLCHIAEFTVICIVNDDNWQKLTLLLRWTAILNTRHHGQHTHTHTHYTHCYTAMLCTSSSTGSERNQETLQPAKVKYDLNKTYINPAFSRYRTSG